MGEGENFWLWKEATRLRMADNNHRKTGLRNDLVW
jgi:hypothetical protein